MVDWMLEDGRVVLLAMAIILVELVFSSRIAGRRRAAFAANALAGLGLLAALYAALTEMGGYAVAAALALALVGHGAYLALLARGRDG